MRHANKSCKLGRTSSHRRCMFANMLKSLIENERVETSVAKAKALRRYADKMITLGKKGGLANRRIALSNIRDEKQVAKLFEVFFLYIVLFRFFVVLLQLQCI